MNIFPLCAFQIATSKKYFNTCLSRDPHMQINKMGTMIDECLLQEYYMFTSIAILGTKML